MEKNPPLRVLLLISTQKLADKAEAMFRQANAPVLYRFHAAGTASSEMMDILGLGSIEKGVLAAIAPKPFADKALQRLHSKLGLGAPGSGVAFTLPLNGVNAILLKMLQPITGEPVPPRKDEALMPNAKHMLIAAVVNQGYSEKVMDAARAAGARGGSVLHSRHIFDGKSEEAISFWGFNVQEEKEIILIISGVENKRDIMEAISSRCGIRSEAQGLVISLPIDAAMGLGELEGDGWNLP